VAMQIVVKHHDLRTHILQLMPIYHRHCLNLKWWEYTESAAICKQVVHMIAS